jgi:predicted HTH transcriptional regulator
MYESWLWKEDDLLNLSRDEVRESTTLEYKSCDALEKTDGKRKEISRDVSALANSARGTIVYGITENRSTHQPDETDVGYDPGIISDEWLEQVINPNI